MSSGSGGRRESNGRSRTRDPCLGKVALGGFMVMRIIIVMLVLVCDRDGIYHREKCTRWKRKRTLSERYGFAKVGHRHWHRLLCCRHHHELIVIMISQRWIIWCNFKESKKTNVSCCWINVSSQESVQRHPHPQIEGAFLVSKKIICIFHPFPHPLGFSFFPPV